MFVPRLNRKANCLWKGDSKGHEDIPLCERKIEGTSIEPPPILRDQSVAEKETILGRNDGIFVRNFLPVFS